MGAQTVAQISGFYTAKYFSNGSIKNYDDVPSHIKRVTRARMVNVAQQFIDHNAWVLAGVSSGDKQELLEYNEILGELFKG